jgi:Family of unknown function (DUF6326)
MSLSQQPLMTSAAALDPAPVNVRVKISALWAAMMFLFAYVDLFTLYRADVRADLQAGKVGSFTLGQGFLLGATAYVTVPSLMVFLSLVLSARVARWVNMVLAAGYLVTDVGSALGESYHYYLLGTALESVLLIAIIGYARTWPRPAHEHATRGHAAR